MSSVDFHQTNCCGQIASHRYLATYYELEAHCSYVVQYLVASAVIHQTIRHPAASNVEQKTTDLMNDYHQTTRHRANAVQMHPSAPAPKAWRRP